MGYLSNFVLPNRTKLILLATPIVLGSGLYFYYYSRKSSTDKSLKQEGQKKKNETVSDNSLQMALSLKVDGNAFFRKANYNEAIQLYSNAISLCPLDRQKELATFYQNRAACYEHLNQCDKVIEDCTKAIQNDKFYVKAYLRRGKAYEALENYEDASFDFYVAASSTKFQNSDYLKLLYESLNKFSYKKTVEVMSKRTSFTFQKYLFKHIVNKYSRDPLKNKMDEILANYDTIVNDLLKDDSRDDDLALDDLLLKGTIEMYIGKHQMGEIKLRKIIAEAEDNDYKVNSLLKLTEFYFQNDKITDAKQCIDEAFIIDPLNADVFYIRSQLHIINKNNDESIQDLQKAIELCPNFPTAIGQKLYIEFQHMSMLNDFVHINRILKEFEQSVQEFPKSSELMLLYFQILLSKNEIKKADSFIVKALENDPDDPTLYVYRALAYIEQGDMEKTKGFLDQALQIDSKCSFAYEMLADLCSKLENPKEAISYLDSAIKTSTGFEDVKNLILKQKSLDLQLRANMFT